MKIRLASPVVVATVSGKTPELPPGVEVELENGARSVLPVRWAKPGEASCRSTGTFEVEGELDTSLYANPLVERRADPYVLKHSDGFYYFTGSVPEYDRIVLRRSRTVAGLADAEETVLWKKHAAGEMGNHIWAPELHHADGKWYIYFAAGTAEDKWAIRQYALECADPDPIAGVWTEKGKIAMNFESFTLDATTFVHNGERYLVWAQYDGDSSDLFLASMSDPWTIKGQQVKISSPEHEWEKQGHKVNEGPAVLKRNGKIFIAFSASATDERYCIGLLAAEETSELLDPASWTKTAVPVMASSARTEQYGPGHNSFTIAEDGGDLLVYHARPYSGLQSGALTDPNRHARVQRLFWLPDGTPYFGEPGDKLDAAGVVARAVVKVT